MPLAVGLSSATAEIIAVGAAVVFTGVVALIVSRAWANSRVKPEERERRRRALLVGQGKMGDATLVDVRDDMVFYSYLVRGVEYTASQDVSLLKEHLPRVLSVDGPVSVRYDARNPANSIVLAEQWSGLRESKAG